MVCTIPKLLPLFDTCVVAFMLAISPHAHSAERIAQNLDTRLSITWQGQELGAVVERLATTQGISFWLDRRINPQQPVNARHSNATLRNVLEQIASDHSLGWSVFDDIVYIGTAESARDLATLSARLRRSLENAPADYRNRWLSAEPVSWPRLSTPREVLHGWLTNAGIELSNPKIIPHDLCNARELPSMSMADRISLLLIGYEMTCEVTPNGRSCRIVPIERPVMITEIHNAGDRARDVLAAFKDNKDVEIQRKGRQLTITGRWEDQQRAAEIIAGEKVPNSQRNLPKKVPKSVSEQRFTLKLENQPVGKTIDQLAGQLGLNVSWDQRLLAGKQDMRQKRVSCEVTNGDLDRLLESVLAPAELSFQLNGNELKILPITP